MAHQHQHHHLPQLTAHSQLTNLEPGQIHCIQLPPTASFLPVPSAPYLAPIRSNFGVPPQSFLHGAPLVQIQGLFGRNAGGCLICSGGLSPRITRRNVSNPAEFFAKLCQLLNIPMQEIEHEWNIDSREALLLCTSCIDTISDLITLNEQLEALRHRLSEEIKIIRAKIRQSSERASITDLRVANFRTQALLQESPFPTYNQPVDGIGNNGSEISYVFNAPPDGKPHGLTEVIIHEQPTDASVPITCLPQYDSSTQTEMESPVPVPVYEAIEFISPVNLPQESISCIQSNASLENPVFELPSELVSGSAEILNVITLDSSEVNLECQNIIADNSNLGDQQTTEQTLEILDLAPQEDHNINIEVQEQEVEAPVSDSVKNKGKPKSKKKGQCSTSQIDAGSKETSKSNKFLGPIETDDEGKMTFKGISISLGETGYVCGTCGAEFGKGHDSNAQRKIKMHIKGVHLGAFKCKICDKNFTSGYILTQHISRTHEQETVPCDVCGRLIKPRSMNTHKYTHMNAEEKEKFMEETGFKPPVFTSTPKLTCQTCGKLFDRPSVLLRHQATHVSKDLRRSFSCEMCGKVYTSEQVLNEHQRLKHGILGRVQNSLCKHCGISLPSKTLRSHMKSHISKEERPFICKICKKRLACERTLNLHEADHKTEETPALYKFECDICGQRFLTVNSRDNHRKKAHKNASPTKGRKRKNKKLKVIPNTTSTSDVPCAFKCLTCNSTFPDFDELDEHDCSNLKSKGTGKRRPPKLRKPNPKAKCPQEEGKTSSFSKEVKTSVKLKRGYVLEYILPEEDEAVPSNNEDQTTESSDNYSSSYDDEMSNN